VSEPDKPAPERRRARRIPLEAIVHYQIGTREYIHLSSDISAEGIFIKNFSPPPVDTELTIQVRLPEEWGGHEVELLGQVVRVSQAEDEGEPGMGVRFTAVKACAPDAIRFFVSEVYEMDHLRRLAEECGSDEPIHFDRDDQKILRIRTGSATGQPAGRGPTWIVAGLLIALGALLGGTAVWVFWIGA